MERAMEAEEEKITLYLKVTKTVPLRVKKSDSIGNVKALLHEKERIPECLQQLCSNGNQLNDVKKLADYGIIKSSTLQVDVEDSVPMMLLVKRPCAKGTFAVYSRIHDTIQSVKSWIGAKERLNPDAFSLIHGGKFLDDSRTLAFLKIYGGSTLHMVFNPRDKFLISVAMPTEETVQIEVKAAMIVRDVKAVIESKVGHHSMDDMDLLFGKQKLDDLKGLYQYDIEENSILEVVPGTIQIFIKKWCGRRVMLNVQRNDLVKNVKGMLLKKLGIPVHLQKLVFEGKCLADSQDLESYNIQKHSNIFLEPHNYFEHPTPLSIQKTPLYNSTGEASSLSSDTAIAHFKPLLENVLKLHNHDLLGKSSPHACVEGSDPLRILVKRPYAEGTITFYSGISDTIQNLKSGIGAKERINSFDFSLVHDGKFLEEDKTIGFLRIDSGSTLYMVFNPADKLFISVIIRTAEIVEIEVKAAFIVRDVKTVIESKVGYPLDDMDIFFGEQKLEDGKALYHYNVEENSILEVVSGKMQISIKKLCGRSILIDVQRHDLVKNVKGILLKKLGIPVHLQKLVFEGKCLSDSRDLSSYNIGKESNILLDFHNYIKHPTPTMPKQLLCNIRSLRPIKLCTITDEEGCLSSSSSIANLKTCIGNVLKEPVKVLLLDGDCLDDMSCLGDYGITNDTTLVVGC